MLPALLARRKWIALALLGTGSALVFYALVLWANNQGIVIHKWHHFRIASATAEKGHAWKIDWNNLPPHSGRFSSWLYVQENGRPLGLSSYDVEPVRNFGKGRFVLAADALLFSASDNSSPMSNGRRYDICVPHFYNVNKLWLLVVCGLVLLAGGLHYSLAGRTSSQVGSRPRRSGRYRGKRWHSLPSRSSCGSPIVIVVWKVRTSPKTPANLFRECRSPMP